MKRFEGKHVVLGVSGSIAAYKACDLITDFREKGAVVTVIMTQDSHHFVTKLSLQSMAGTEVIDDFFSTTGRVKPVHIEIAKKADAMVIAPASADIIAKLACGFAEDVLTCSVLASEAPLVIAPAMNEKMYFKKVTQENIEKLKKNGVIFVSPIKGHLVCMDQGMGHLADNLSILNAVSSALKI